MLTEVALAVVQERTLEPPLITVAGWAANVIVGAAFCVGPVPEFPEQPSAAMKKARANTGGIRLEN